MGKNRIYMFGPCTIRGSLVKDDDTIASRLASRVSNVYEIKCYGTVWDDVSFAIRRQTYSAGDEVIIMASDKKIYDENGIKVYSIIEAYNRVPQLLENVWDCLKHCNHMVMKEIAEEIYDILCKEKLLNPLMINNKANPVSFGSREDILESLLPEELLKWLEDTKRYKVIGKDVQSVGGIVMNCNPFTLGHRYLIEQAKSQVDVLYVFVVEENKSYFEFDDRFSMVKLGVSDLKNVVVIPSGKYIISTITLPGYFNKEDQPYVEMDATDDLEIFARIIAKFFGFQIRFAGEEPIDVFTRRYNLAMNEILPKYGVEFREIPRKECDGCVISASRVRKCIEQRNYEEVRNLVMPCIYEYLERKYFN